MLLPPPIEPASAPAAPIIPRDALRLARRAPKTTIAFVDLETTGLDPSRHDIIEIGIVRVDARTLEVLDEYEALVAPKPPASAPPPTRNLDETFTLVLPKEDE